jgi:hypothetical protein
LEVGVKRVVRGNRGIETHQLLCETGHWDRDFENGLDHWVWPDQGIQPLIVGRGLQTFTGQMCNHPIDTVGVFFEHEGGALHVESISTFFPAEARMEINKTFDRLIQQGLCSSVAIMSYLQEDSIGCRGHAWNVFCRFLALRGLFLHHGKGGLGEEVET